MSTGTLSLLLFGGWLAVALLQPRRTAD